MELMRKAGIPVLTNSGIESRQLLFPENSSSERVTITSVTVPPGAISPRHKHDASEQIWVALEGAGELLLAHDTREIFAAGDVARFADGEIHGFCNTGAVPFIYISVTAPPLNFRKAYAADWNNAGQS